MLTSLKLDKFKCFGSEQKVRLAPITLLYGPNSGGKSSIIQSLLLLKQSIDSDLSQHHQFIFRGDYVDLGSFKLAIFNHDTRRQITIGIGYSGITNRKRRRYGYIRPHKEAELDFSIGLVEEPGSRVKERTCPVLTKLHINLREFSSQEDEVKPLNFTLRRQKVDLKVNRRRHLMFDPLARITFGYVLYGATSIRSFSEFLIQLRGSRRHLSRRHPTRKAKSMSNKGETTDITPNRDIRTQKQKDKAETRDFCKSMIFAQRGIFPEALISGNERSSTLSRANTDIMFMNLFSTSDDFRESLDSLSYLGPLRSPPERHYVLKGGAFLTVGKTGEQTPRIIYRRPEIRKDIDRWLKNFDIPYKIKPRKLGNEFTGELMSLNLQDTNSNIIIGPSDVGFGIGQLLPVLVEGLVSQDRTICVEQPEIHLHPRLQAHLADFLIETSATDKKIKALSRHKSGGKKAALMRENQWIVETHSEALLLRLKRRIKEGKLAASDICVLYINPDGDQGATIEELRMNDAGEFIDEWPHGFFEESFTEIFDF